MVEDNNLYAVGAGISRDEKCMGVLSIRQFMAARLYPDFVT